MNDRIHELKKELESKSFEKSTEKPVEEIKKPIEKIEPIIEKKSIIEDIIKEVEEKPLEVAESIQIPKLAPQPKPVYIPKKILV